MKFVHGEPIIEFTMEEVNQFTIEEGLHQAVIMKFSYGKPDVHELRKLVPKQYDIKGMCNIGQLEFRHILVRFDLFEDYVQFLSRSVGYIKDKGDEFFFRTFPWTIGLNPKEETSKSVVWISFPDLPPNFFAKKSLLSIASAVGKPLAVDKATQDQTRPSAARVKVLLDLLDKHPKRVKLHIVDKSTGKFVEHYQEVVYDNLPKFCTFCKHQGHEERTCPLMTEKDKVGDGVGIENMVVQELPVVETNGVEKLQGDARAYLNAKRASQRVNELPDSNSGKLEVEAPKENSILQQVSQTDGGNLANRAGNGTTGGEVSMIDKGPPKPTRDVPSKTALARIFNVVNPIVQAYDKQKLSEAATANRDEVSAKIGNVEDGLADGNRGLAGVEQSLHVPYENAVPGKYSAIVVSNLEATVPLSVTSDRAVVVGSTDASRIVGVQESNARVTAVVDEKGQLDVNPARCEVANKRGSSCI